MGLEPAHPPAFPLDRPAGLIFAFCNHAGALSDSLIGHPLGCVHYLGVPVKKSVLLTAVAAAAAGALVASASVASADGDDKALTPDARSRLLKVAPGQEGGSHQEPGTQGVLRVAGADRYETAAHMSQTLWSEENTGAVFLATGERFPDAVAASASTALLGPVLLTMPHELPQATRDELARLRPCLVFVVGGDNSVDPNVAMEADAYTNPERCFG